MKIDQLLQQSQGLAKDLETLGDDANFGDFADRIGPYRELICHLPALAQLAAQAELLVKARGRFHTEHNYTALVQALSELKEM